MATERSHKRAHPLAHRTHKAFDLLYSEAKLQLHMSTESVPEGSHDNNNENYNTDHQDSPYEAPTQPSTPVPQGEEASKRADAAPTESKVRTHNNKKKKIVHVISSLDPVDNKPVCFLCKMRMDVPGISRLGINMPTCSIKIHEHSCVKKMICCYECRSSIMEQSFRVLTEDTKTSEEARRFLTTIVLDHIFKVQNSAMSQGV